jgi:2-polyprenyl-3-methyl-5-hydroxy-6-metoxy-1,4-benzoquinol methylase
MDALERHLAQQIEHGREFFWHRLRWEVVSRYLPAGSFTLVDVGAGVGLVGEFLREERPEAAYRFVEPIQFLEEHLERRYGAAANAKDDARYEGAAVVTLLDVLEHQADDRAFMAELAGRLDPGATLLVTVPAGGYLWSGWDVALGHHRRYDRSSFRRALAGLPLAVVELDYLFPELVPLGLVRKVLRRPAGTEADAEFPELPRPVNVGLYGIGRASLALRRRWPAGTSLLAVLRRA